LVEAETVVFPTKVPLYWPGQKKETRIYSFRDLPTLIRAMRVVFKKCAENGGHSMLSRLISSRQFMEDSFIVSLWARFGKELAENFSVNILTPILVEALRKMLQERDIQLKGKI